MTKLPFSVVHFGKNNPDAHVGGVETFARNLRLVFDQVDFLYEGCRDFDDVRKQRRLVICDNHWVRKLPTGIPAIGFQHGVADVKRRATKRWFDRRLAWQQARAAKRPNTLWVACAEWISAAFGNLYGNAASHVVYHQVDLTRFDGVRNPGHSRLILHDARTVNKGSTQLRQLEAAFPQWQFEPLNCSPEEVPDRMSRAAAFIHLSRYEGNSIVCNEAMAQNLPCLFTRVGLLQDSARPTEVALIEPAEAFGSPEQLKRQVGQFLQSLATRDYQPRQWILDHASREKNLEAWRQVVDSWQRLPWPTA